MLISKYGIVLKRLKHEDIELVRQMRNTPDIRESMFVQQEISEAEQEKWFVSVNNKFNNYFVILYEGRKAGLINGKNVDYTERSSEGGIFIWEKELLHSMVPVAASVVANDFSFFVLSFNKTYSRVRLDNVQAIQYNKQMGYRETATNTVNGEILMELSAEDYRKNAGRIRQGLQVLYNDHTPLSLDDISFADDTPADFKNLYTGLPSYTTDMIKQILQREGRDPVSVGL